MEIELVNVVAGGTLDVEINLHSAFDQIGASDATYEPEIAPGLQLQLKGATIMLFHSGKYHLTGADSFENAREAAEKLTEVLENVMGEEVQQEHFEIRNLLYKGEFGIEFDLEKLHSDLPAKTEYYPENHPGLYFKSDITDGSLIVFRTGKYTVTGLTDNEKASLLIEEFRNKVGFSTGNEGVLD